MAEFVLPPEMEAFAEAAGDAAMGPFQAADFAADPSAAFSEGMGAAMDFMTDAGMPPDMMANISNVAQGAFDAHMAANPDSPPMEAFDAVGGALDFHMADFPADMPCMDMAGDFPPPPEDFGPMMDGAPPYGDFPGGPEFDAAAMPDAWEPGPMTDMGPGGEPGPMAGGDMPPPGDDAPIPGEADYVGPGGEPGPMAGGDMPPPGDDAPIPGEADYVGPGGPDPLFGEGGPAGGPPPGDPGGPPPGEYDPSYANTTGDDMGTPADGGGYDATTIAPGADNMADMQSHMDDAGAHQGPEGPPPGDPGPMPGDMPADMPPPPDDPNDGGEVV